MTDVADQSTRLREPAVARRDGVIPKALLLGALGVVFGDIGTSPLYAFKQTLRASAVQSPSIAAADIYGLLSLIFWALLVVVTFKYVLFVMRADNQGEGGILSLMALSLPKVGDEGVRKIFLAVGVIGAALFFGDGLITPAISVLSAVEGLSVATPLFTPYVVPIALAMLIGLFIIQSQGSGSIGVYFGPIMLAWFSVIGVTGAVHLIPHPELLAAINPIYAADYLATHDVSRLLAVLGAVFLALTGAEALYADMGHFGRRAIRFDWFLLVFPSLILNYFGQGALILSHPEGVDNPFFRLFPPWSLYLAVALATAATVIASQAVISGAYTLAQQAIHLGLLPRLNIEQTSKSEAGQIYIPQINWLLAAGVAGLVLGFGSSDALSSAYGIAVVTTMIATTILSLLVAHLRWQWGFLPLLGIGGIFLAVDLAFFGANILKIPQGGWFPLIVGALVFMLMMTWRRGRKLVLERLGEDNGPMSGLLKKLKGANLARVEGTAVYLSARKDRVPSALALNLRHNKVLHDRVAILNVISERVPRVEECERLAVHSLGEGLYLITMRFGFAEKQNVMAAFESHRDLFSVDPKTTTFFVGRELPVPKVRPDLPFWQAVLYGFLTRNAVSVADYLEIPNENIVDLGTRIEL